jgi:hypothetical protein
MIYSIHKFYHHAETLVCTPDAVFLIIFITRNLTYRIITLFQGYYAGWVKKCDVVRSVKLIAC